MAPWWQWWQTLLMCSILSSPCKSLLMGQSSFIELSRRKEARYLSNYSYGTSLVLIMTGLDVQASKMENVRDQISFLIHYMLHTMAEEGASLLATYGGKLGRLCLTSLRQVHRTPTMCMSFEKEEHATSKKQTSLHCIQEMCFISS